MRSLDRKLLVLDLDETLVHASPQPLQRRADFCLGLHHVYLRPHLSRFLTFALTTFDVGIWTAAGEQYAEEVVKRIFDDDAPLRFVWSASQCTLSRDRATGEYRTVKKLRKLEGQGYALETAIAIDDTPTTYARYYGNLVTVNEYRGAEDDHELLLLERFLEHISMVPNVRAVEKRRWRSEVNGVSAGGRP